ncbi:MAG: FAD-binding protein [Spirochaetaceae bacterium]|jgi:electron transfer flavoprotein alpha subunit|nr:FAD-binding protein [Spirochaetaceae bacterium]
MDGNKTVVLVFSISDSVSDKDYSGAGKGKTEKWLPLLRNLIEKMQPHLVLTGSGLDEKECSVRLALEMHSVCALDINAIRQTESGFIIKRPVQGLQLEAEFSCPFPSPASPCFFTMAQGGCNIGEGINLPAPLVIHYEEPPATAVAESLIDKDIIFAGGRGLGKKENATALSGLVKNLNESTHINVDCAVGASRPAVWNGWFPPSAMIGLSGISVRPKLIVTFGISGCAPFMHGIEKSEKIISVNSDADAAIFASSDIGLCADANEVIRLLHTKIEEEQ